MKKIFLLLALNSIIVVAQAQDFIWAKSIGGVGPENGTASVVDANGNIYTTGQFASTSADFDPGPGVYTLGCTGCIPTSMVDDIFITKFDASGNFVWAKVIGSTNYDDGYAIATDNSGNVF